MIEEQIIINSDGEVLFQYDIQQQQELLSTTQQHQIKEQIKSSSSSSGCCHSQYKISKQKKSNVSSSFSCQIIPNLTPEQQHSNQKLCQEEERQTQQLKKEISLIQKQISQFNSHYLSQQNITITNDDNKSNVLLSCSQESSSSPSPPSSSPITAVQKQIKLLKQMIQNRKKIQYVFQRQLQNIQKTIKKYQQIQINYHHNKQSQKHNKNKNFQQNDDDNEIKQQIIFLAQKQEQQLYDGNAGDGGDHFQRQQQQRERSPPLYQLLLQSINQEKQKINKIQKEINEKCKNLQQNDSITRQVQNIVQDDVVDDDNNQSSSPQSAGMRKSKITNHTKTNTKTKSYFELSNQVHTKKIQSQKYQNKLFKLQAQMNKSLTKRQQIKQKLDKLLKVLIDLQQLPVSAQINQQQHQQTNNPNIISLQSSVVEQPQSKLVKQTTSLRQTTPITTQQQQSSNQKTQKYKQRFSSLENIINHSDKKSKQNNNLFKLLTKKKENTYKLNNIQKHRNHKAIKQLQNQIKQLAKQIKMKQLSIQERTKQNTRLLELNDALQPQREQRSKPKAARPALQKLLTKHQQQLQQKYKIPFINKANKNKQIKNISMTSVSDKNKKNFLDTQRFCQSQIQNNSIPMIQKSFSHRYMQSNRNKDQNQVLSSFIKKQQKEFRLTKPKFPKSFSQQRKKIVNNVSITNSQSKKTLAKEKSLILNRSSIVNSNNNKRISNNSIISIQNQDKIIEDYDSNYSNNKKKLSNNNNHNQKHKHNHNHQVLSKHKRKFSSSQHNRMIIDRNYQRRQKALQVDILKNRNESHSSKQLSWQSSLCLLKDKIQENIDKYSKKQLQQTQQSSSNNKTNEKENNQTTQTKIVPSIISATDNVETSRMKRRTMKGLKPKLFKKVLQTDKVLEKQKTQRILLQQQLKQKSKQKNTQSHLVLHNKKSNNVNIQQQTTFFTNQKYSSMCQQMQKVKEQISNTVKKLQKMQNQADTQQQQRVSKSISKNRIKNATDNNNIKQLNLIQEQISLPYFNFLEEKGRHILGLGADTDSCPQEQQQQQQILQQIQPKQEKNN